MLPLCLHPFSDTLGFSRKVLRLLEVTQQRQDWWQWYYCCYSSLERTDGETVHTSNQSSSFERLTVKLIHTFARLNLCPNFALSLLALRGSLLMWAVMLLLRIHLILNTPFQLGGSLTFYFHLFKLSIHLLNLIIIRWVLQSREGRHAVCWWRRTVWLLLVAILP